MKMMLGACSRAITNSSRTMREPSSMYYFCTSSSGHTNERTIRVVGDRTLEKGLPGTRRAI